MKRYFTLACWFTTVLLKAQDPEFSQYYAAPLYLNPAFAGSSEDHRFIANYRNQWPNVPNAFQTYAISYDYSLSAVNSGVGIFIMTDKAGSANLKSTQVNFQYSYKVNLHNKWMLASGLNFGLGFRSIDYNKLIFYDQLDFDQDGIDVPPAANLNLQNSSYFDFGGGLLAYNRKFWIGITALHLNQPNRSLIDEEAVIPVKTTLHGGVRIPLYNGMLKRDRVASVAPSFVYKQQGNFDQLDIGTYFLYEPLVLGLWYRGIPIQQNIKDNISHDAVVVILGFQMQWVELTYSYDVTVSEMGPSPGGAHELALKLHAPALARSKHKKKERFIPCPTFGK